MNETRRLRATASLKPLLSHTAFSGGNNHKFKSEKTECAAIKRWRSLPSSVFGKIDEKWPSSVLLGLRRAAAVHRCSNSAPSIDRQHNACVQLSTDPNRNSDSCLRPVYLFLDGSSCPLSLLKLAKIIRREKHSSHSSLLSDVQHFKVFLHIHFFSFPSSFLP